MTLSRREFLALIGSTVVGADTLWQPRNVQARAWSLEDFAQNVESGGLLKDAIPPIDRPKYVSAAESESFDARTTSCFGIKRRDDHAF